MALFPIVLGSIFLLNCLFSIKKIAVSSDEKNIKLIGLESLKNLNLIFFDPKTAEIDIVQKNPSIKTVNITKKYPDKIIIDIEKDQPIAVLRADQGFFFLSAEGKIIFKKKDNDTRLPLINYYQNFYYYQYQAGEKIDYDEVLASVDFLKRTDSLGLKVDTVDISGVHMVAFNLGDKKILFSLEKDRRVQDFQLETIIKQFKIEGKEFFSLDLRFDKPVIKLK